MGRRTTSTTKGGKFMNPTDQARKEARRRELKKNKKQRMAVRQAVIKTKDPHQMIRELEDLDDMELDPTAETQYNEKVIKDKRRKLLETLFRVVDFYFKEDSARGHDLKSAIDTYKLNRAKKEMYYESVKNAQMVEINSIPLPEAPFEFETPHLSEIPLPGIKPASILKKLPPGPPIGLPPVMQGEKKPPGPPPGVPPAKKVFGRGTKLLHPLPVPGSPPPEEEREVNDDDPYDPEEGPELIDEPDEKFHLPPDLDDDDDDDEEFHHRDDDENDLLPEGNESDEENQTSRKRSVRFLDDDDDVEQKDDEDAAKEASSSGVTPLQAMMLKMAGQTMPAGKPPNKLPKQDEDYDDDEDQMEDDGDQEEKRPKPPGPPPGLPPGPPPGMPPAMLGRPNIMPPGPPPGRPPVMPMNVGHRMMGPPDADGMRMMQNPNVLSAPPSLIHRPSDKDMDDTQAATITAKPKLTTNLKVDSTRFMPTSLRIRRETKNRPGAAASNVSTAAPAEKQTIERKKKQHTNTADAAYDSFMKEMQDFL